MKRPDTEATLLAVDAIAQEDFQEVPRKLFRDTALVLRGIVIEWVMTDLPKLVKSVEPGRVELYGGITVQVADGVISSTPRRVLEYATSNDAPTLLYNAVMAKLRGEYGDRLMTHLAEHPLKLNAKTLRVLKDCWGWMQGRKGLALRYLGKTSGRVLAGHVAKLMWDNGIYDHQLQSLAMRIGGHQASLDMYNMIARNRDDVRARVQEAPNLACLLSTGGHYSMRIEADQTVFQRLRDSFLSDGGTPAGWRWITQQGARTVGRVLLSGSRRRAQLANAMARAQAGKVPYCQAFHNVHVNEEHMDMWARAVRLASEAYARKELKVTDLSHQFPLVWDFVKRAGASVLAMKGSTWKSLYRRQDEWHREQARIAREKARASRGVYAWQPLVQEVEEPKLGVKAVSLNDSDLLWEEGDHMGHCVGGYYQHCFQNRSRIYSMRAGEDRVATMELRHDGRRWSIAQLYGPRNRPVQHDGVRTLAKRVLRMCNRAEIPPQGENKVLRPPEKPQRVAPQPAPARRWNMEPEGEMIPF